MESLFLSELNIHKNWQAFLSDSNTGIIKKIEEDISGDDYTPSSERILRFLEFPLSAAKIIIVGQDPYPQPGVATGRAFEVGDLKSWDEKFRNISLKNIIRAIYKAYTGKILKYNEIKDKLNGEFSILPPGILFRHWESEGVLLLNTSFTCKHGIPGSHKKIWKEFTNLLLEYINCQNPDITWFLWGNHAREATRHLHIKNSIYLMHPMMCYDMPGRERDFLYGNENCFERFAGEIDWTGYA